jgi:nicotinamide-nucleotide amidase
MSTPTPSDAPNNPTTPAAASIDACARAVIDACRERELRLVTAESLTGGLIASALTAIPGASDVLDRAFVVYSYAAKAQMLGVPYELVSACSAVSEAVARAMATGALARSHPEAQLSVAVTGVAGPGPLDAEHPAGLVHLAIARTSYAAPELTHVELRLGDIGRDEVRHATVAAALALVLQVLTRDSR